MQSSIKDLKLIISNAFSLSTFTEISLPVNGRVFHDSVEASHR